MKYLISHTSFLFISLLLYTSCTSVYERVYPGLIDGKYDSEFPYKNSSAQLEKISRSIKLINSIAFYTSYVFGDGSSYKDADLKRIDFETTAKEKVYFNRTASGSATLINEDNGKVLLMTVAHIVSFPDTIITYFLESDGTPTQNVESISIKTRQSNYVPDLPAGTKLDIVLIDKNVDVALLGGYFPLTEISRTDVFNYPWGKSAELEWGSFVYVFGFPMNYKIISKGIVSNPGRERDIFVIDAVFNRGFSGGIVLAVRDGVPNFELVGLVKSVPSDYQYTLRPLSKQHDLEFNPYLPYQGEIYVEKEQILRMGITKVIRIEAINELIEQNKTRLADKGYNMQQFIK
jgi:hypothetical protein